ncbi:Zn 2cys6 transcription factor protein [Lasiodiplodia theobromae]|uniref:Zn 2cys6 transcription factor protein n=1 Tax=Lasiodiplodia theobromae TaxID=45133 RepID=UPI0015C2C55C|nr:Zn 2cys6 transcription factor protein [Lasiodiplodia theobromae]KAF4544227.1 Zn 2cys6 transcription factor protein [Lasiodiplodia theobromae]
MDEGPRQRARGNTSRNAAVPNERSTERPLPPSRPKTHEEHHVHQTPCTDIETVRTKTTTSGAVFSTMKIVSDEPQSDPALSYPPLKHQRLPPAHVLSPQDVRAKKQLQRQRAVFGGLPQTLPLSGIEILTSRLVATLNEEGPSNQIKLFGPFIGEVPRRLGSTTALNDAAACLTTTHDAIIRKHSKTRINPQLYAKALKSLHAAIQDESQVRSTSTLCATVLLAITEAYAVGVCGTNRNFITHLGGAARILELRGPEEFQNPSSFERALLRAITVGVGLDAIFTGKEDILATREWHDIAFDTTGVTEPRASMFKISRTLSLLPSLTRDVRAFFAGTFSTSSSPRMTRLALLHRAETLLKMLDEVRPYIDATLADEARVRLVPAAKEHADLWPKAYRFADAGVAFVLWFFWNMRMIASSIIIGLHRRPDPPSTATSSPSPSSASPSASPSPPSSSSFPSPPTSPPCPQSSFYPPSLLAALERDTIRMAHDVCMSWEHARAVRPLGAMYIDVGLIIAYGIFATAGDTARQGWLLRALADLTEGHPGEGTGEGIAGRAFEGSTKDWTAERVEWLGRWFSAGCVDFVGMSGLNGEEEVGEEATGSAGSSPVGSANASPLLTDRDASPQLTSSMWDEWAFASGGGQADFFGGWNNASDLSSFQAAGSSSAYGAVAAAAPTGGGYAESIASGSTATGLAAAAGGAAPTGRRIRWHTPTTTATANGGMNYGFDSFNNNFGGAPLQSKSFVA